MYAICNFGSEEQKEHYLPSMATGTIVGCFETTEPDAGSDPANMKTIAKKVEVGFFIIRFKNLDNKFTNCRSLHYLGKG